MGMNNARLRMFARAAVIAALYTVLTLAIPVASYGQIQVRISEALMILPVFTPAAVPACSWAACWPTPSARC